MVTLTEKRKQFEKKIAELELEYVRAYRKLEDAKIGLKRLAELQGRLFFFGDCSVLFGHMGYWDDGRIVLGAYGLKRQKELMLFVCPESEMSKLRPAGLTDEHALLSRMRKDLENNNFRIKNK